METNDGFKVRYEDANLLDTCTQFFSRKQAFILICNDESIAKCRKAADLFLQYESQQPRGRWENLKKLAKLGVAGMRTPPLMAVCNRALLVDWTVTVRREENHVIHLSPKNNS